MDLAESHYLSLDLILKGNAQYNIFNIGSGKAVSVLEVVKTFERVNKVKVPFIFSERRKGDVHKLVSHNARAKKVLNWKPRKNLLDICKDSWNWNLKNPMGYL